MLASLLQHLVIATLLAVIVAVACRVMRPAPAVRHALWLVVLIKLAMPPVVVVQTPWAWPALPDLGLVRLLEPNDPGRSPARPSLAAAEASPIPTSASVLSSTVSRSAGSNQPGLVTDNAATPPAINAGRAAHRYSTAALVAGIWTFGAVLYLALQVVRIVRLRRSLQNSRPANHSLVERMEALARRANLPVVPIRAVPALGSPLIWSIRRPVLLWPDNLPADLSDACLDGLIVHELAHVSRRDHWVSWLELIAGAIWWWNPLFWYVRSQVREHAELACDACVVASLPQGRRAYAEALVAVCEIASRRTAPVPAIGVSTGSRRVLERRLVMIMRGNSSARLPRIVFAAIAVLIAATVPVWAQRATTPPRVGMPIIEVPATEVAPEVRLPAPAPPPVFSTVPVGPAQPTLPTEAQRLIARFEDEQALTRREADARLSQQRNDVIKQLEALQDSYTKAGRLVDATAIRDRIRMLQSDRRSGVTILSAPMAAPRVTTPDRNNLTKYTEAAPERDSLTSFRGQVGDTVAMTVTGRTDGTVWGTGVYTDDSSLSAAAVHAGVVREGETRTVLVRILPGRDSYDGSSQNAVRSQEYGEWGGSYRIEGVTSAPPSVVPGNRRPPTATAPTPAPRSDPQPNLTSFRDHVWESFTMEVVGSVDGSVWGTDIYTDDSSIATAAVHAGLLKVGERGNLKVTLLPGQSRYSGANRNGVTTSDYGAWEGSFRLERVK